MTTPTAVLAVADYATYLGFQEGSDTIPGFELWNLTQPIPGHPIGSTVARSTIEKHIARLHAEDAQAEHFAEARRGKPAITNPHGA